MAIQDELPQSRITLKYRTTINGVEEDMSLPFRLLVLGDFSGGSSEDRKKDLAERGTRSITGKNLDAVMKDMKLSLDFNVPNHIDPDNDGELNVKLKIENMGSFSPGAIAAQVPKVRALLLLKTLLQEIQSNIDNRKELRKVLSDLLANPIEFQAALEQLKAYRGLKLPDTHSASAGAHGNAPRLAATGSEAAPAGVELQ